MSITSFSIDIPPLKILKISNERETFECQNSKSDWHIFVFIYFENLIFSNKQIAQIFSLQFRNVYFTRFKNDNWFFPYFNEKNRKHPIFLKIWRKKNKKLANSWNFSTFLDFIFFALFFLFIFFIICLAFSKTLWADVLNWKFQQMTLKLGNFVEGFRDRSVT